jgi:hypothetical protein
VQPSAGHINVVPSLPRFATLPGGHIEAVQYDAPGLVGGYVGAIGTEQQNAETDMPVGTVAPSLLVSKVDPIVVSHVAFVASQTCAAVKLSATQHTSLVQPVEGQAVKRSVLEMTHPVGHTDEVQSAAPPLPLPSPLPLPVGHPGVVSVVGRLAQYAAFDMPLWHAMQSAIMAVQHTFPLLSMPPFVEQCDAHITIPGQLGLTWS